MDRISIVNWNVEWRPAKSRAAEIIRNRIWNVNPDLVCLTEADPDFLDGAGYRIEAEPDCGYGARPDRRKVILWSKLPWRNVDRVGAPGLPRGRFVRGRTDSSLGEIDVLGVCLPWPAAHVSTGRKDRVRWEDHLTYLGCLGREVPIPTDRTLLMGDFNQTLPRSRAPLAAYEALQRSVISRLHVATAGPLAPLHELAIDHVAHSPDLRPSLVQSISPVGPAGERLSDHFGVHVELVAA